jgi:hypothetical protein
VCARFVVVVGGRRACWCNEDQEPGIDCKAGIGTGWEKWRGRLFERFDQILTDGGMIGRKGSIVDASFADAPRQRNMRKENEQIKEGKRPEGFEERSAQQ